MKTLADLLVSIVPYRRADRGTHLPDACPSCDRELAAATSPLLQRYHVCDGCGHHFHLSARQRIQQLVDAGSFREVNRSLASIDPLSFVDRLPYRQRLDEARKRTGAGEAVVTGTCRIGGTAAVLAVLDFEFLGGSMGSVVGEKVTLAVELAVKRKLPIVTVATSGGARMQEGMLSLVQMAKTAAAVRKLREVRLPFISILADPTTGGIYASFASLGDVTIAEPDALIGFAGPRVMEQTTHTSWPEGQFRAEYLLRQGAIDAIVDRPALRDRVADLLLILSTKAGSRFSVQGRTEEFTADDAITGAWDRVQLARHPERPVARDHIAAVTTDFFELHGDRSSGDDPAMVVGLARLDGLPVAIAAQQRGSGTDDDPTRGGRPAAAGYRKALRLFHLANKFALPLITLIDTPGAHTAVESEEHGLAPALAECLAALSGLTTITVAVVIGEGGSGGAIALGVADRVLMMENAIYSVISPEGAAAILYRDASRADELAASLRITATDCLALGVIDGIVREPDGGAHVHPALASQLLKLALSEALADLQTVPLRKTMQARYQKFRHMGKYNHAFALAVSREVAAVQESMQRGLRGLRDHLPGQRPPRRADAASEGTLTA